MIGYIALAAPTIMALCSCALAGRPAGISVTAIWIAATVYFFMAPTYSFRVSNSRDVAAANWHRSESQRCWLRNIGRLELEPELGVERL